MTKTALLCAGGTGGHLFPAQALARELKQRGWQVHLATDPRAERFLGDFACDGVHVIPSATFAGKNPIQLARAAWRLLKGYMRARQMIAQNKPSVVVGFGGYPTLPPLLAASHKNVACILHEQNAVMGRANRFLASKVDVVATGFEINNEANSPNVTNGISSVVTGNPLRAIAHQAAKVDYAPASTDGPFNLLVFGGSQGASYFAQVIPSALALLDVALRQKLHLTLQARPEDIEGVQHALTDLGVEAHVDSFFNNLPQHIAASHLVVSRAGASTVSELALIGRPAILVPYPGSLDDDQGKNAASLQAAEGAVLVRQKELTAEQLAKRLASAMQEPQKLAIQAQNAKNTAIPDAAHRLADLVEAQI